MPPEARSASLDVSFSARKRLIHKLPPSVAVAHQITRAGPLVAAGTRLRPVCHGNSRLALFGARSQTKTRAPLIRLLIKDSHQSCWNATARNFLHECFGGD